MRGFHLFSGVLLLISSAAPVLAVDSFETDVRIYQWNDGAFEISMMPAGGAPIDPVPVVPTGSITPAPEPSTLLLLLCGTVAALATRRNRGRSLQ